MLIENYQKKDTSTRLKKFNSTFNQTIRLSTVYNGPISGWDNQILYHNSEDLYKWFEKYLAPYIVTIKNCRNIKTKCVENYEICNPKSGNCSNVNKELSTKILYVFADGGIITALTGGNYNPDTGIVNGGVGLLITYDTNGYKKPNIIGKDIFTFEMNFDSNDNSFLNCTGCINGCKDGNVDNLSIPRKELIDACKLEPTTCSCLLMHDEWEFKKDYPW